MQRRDRANDLTVVVIGLNSAATIEACLIGVRRAFAMMGGDARVLYVDGGSKDATVSLAREQGAEVIQLVTDRPTAAKGRNAGWRAASTPFVQFVDSDTVLEPDWLERGLRAIQVDDRIACLFGQLQEANPSASIFNEVSGCDWYVPPGDWRMCGGNALFRLAALRQVGGFDDDLAAGEEADLCWRIRQGGGRIVCIDAVMGHHDLAMTGFRSYWRRAERSGYAYAKIGIRFARTDDPMWLRETIRNLVVLPVVVVVATVLSVWLGPPGLGGLVAVVLGRLAWKFGALRSRIPSARLRAFYLGHLAFTRLPLFVGTVRCVCDHVRRRSSRG